MAEAWKLQTDRSQTDKSQTDKSYGSLSEEWGVPMLAVFGTILAGAACFFLLTYYLFQPTLSPNPGLAAYTPPPGTRLVPLPRKSDAPELAELPAEPSSVARASGASASGPRTAGLSALAQAQPSDQPSKREAHPPVHKRPRLEPREDDRGKYGPDQQWKFGYRDWNNNNSNNNRAWASSSRPWF
jgi:hypothetical protein